MIKISKYNVDCQLKKNIKKFPEINPTMLFLILENEAISYVYSVKNKFKILFYIKKNLILLKTMLKIKAHFKTQTLIPPTCIFAVNF